MSLLVQTNLISDGTAVVSVRGEIDHGNAGELTSTIRSVLATRRPRTVRVDLGLVTFMDSGAVGALVAAYRLARAQGVRLKVTDPSPFVRRQLEIAGVAELLGTS